MLAAPPRPSARPTGCSSRVGPHGAAPLRIAPVARLDRGAGIARFGRHSPARGRARWAGRSTSEDQPCDTPRATAPRRRIGSCSSRRSRYPTWSPPGAPSWRTPSDKFRLVGALRRIGGTRSVADDELADRIDWP